MRNESKVSLQLYPPTKSIIIDAHRVMGPTRSQWPVNVGFFFWAGGGGMRVIWITHFLSMGTFKSF